MALAKLFIKFISLCFQLAVNGKPIYNFLHKPRMGIHAWKDLTKSSPNEVFINTAKRSTKILAKDKKRKATEQ